MKTPEKSTRSTRRALQKAETRELILSTARRAFEQNGFEETTFRLVAKDAGVGLGTIFGHFSNKESLLVAALIDDLESDDRRAWETMREDSSIKDKLLHLASEGFRAWLQRPQLFRVLAREIMWKPGAPQRRIRELDRDAMHKASTLLSQAQSEGEIRPHIDIELAVRTMFSFYLTTVLYRLDDNCPTQPNDGWVLSRLEPMVEEAKRFLHQIFVGIGMEQVRSKGDD